MKRKHIALLLPNLRGGGAQRVMITLANEFAKRNFQTDLVLVKQIGPFSKYVSSDVNVFDLNATRALTSLPGLVQYLRQRSPCGLLSTLAGTNVVAALSHLISGSEATLALRETNPVSIASNRYSSLKGKVIHLFLFWAYRYADYVIGISKGMTNDIVDVFGLPSNKTVTIYNPLDPTQRSHTNTNGEDIISGDTPTVLGMGRLVVEKDFSTLIRAFSRVRSERSSRLYILGEGENRRTLEKVAESCGVQSDVHMPGFAEDPFAYMKSADVFVLSSRWEGFGNVLVEAMACGTPVISTDCPTGPSEILENGKWGQLVPVGDEEAMAEAIRTTLDGAQDSIDPTRRAEDFHVKGIADKYLQTLA